MATRISAATGNFTTAGTWKAVSAVANAEVDSDANGALNATNTNLDSTAFVLAATAVDAIAIKLASVVTPTGTISVIIRNSTTATDTKTVTINCSDINAQARGWHVFSFASFTPNGTDSYVIRVVRSVVDSAGDRVTLLSTSGTAATMSRMVRMTTTGAPASGERIVIAGEFTGAGAATSYTITMDNTATTSFGATVSGGPAQGITVNDKSTLTWGVTASTAYYLKWKGPFLIYAGGTVNIGTSGARMPSTSSAVLEFDSAANVDTGIDARPGCTFNVYANAITNVKAKLNANASAAATALTTDISTGWLNGDEIAIASTTRTASNTEKKTMGANAAGTAIGTIAAITNAHSGTSPTQAELANLTRNIKFRGISTSLQGYMIIQTTSTVHIEYAEFLQMGSASAGKRGIDITTNTGSCSITFCALHDFIVASSLGLNISTGTSNNITISNNVTYNIANNHLVVAATSGTANVFSDNLFMLVADASTNVIAYNDIGGTFTNNTAVSATNDGISVNEGSAVIGTFSGNTVHSCGASGLVINGSMINSTISSTTVWRTNNGGIYFNTPGCNGNIIDTATIFGCTFVSIRLERMANCVFKSIVSSGDSSFGTVSGIEVLSSGVAVAMRFENCTFGVASGIKVAHTQDINITINTYLDLYFHNCLLSSSTELTGQSLIAAGGKIRSQKHDQTVASHKTWMREGTISYDASVFNTAAPSQLLTPISASNKLISGTKSGVVDSGGTLTFKVYVRKNASYNGNEPRLVLRKNVAAGIAADTVLDTVSVGLSTWEQLTGTTAAVTDDAVLECFVDCDGTAGAVNVDDWIVN